MALADGYFSLSEDINKVRGDQITNDVNEGVVGDLLPELRLDMDDKELLALKKKWETKWVNYEKEILQLQKQNEEYWLGRQHPGIRYKPTERELTDNLIFESLETYLPLATKNNPEPMVSADNTDLGVSLANTTQKYLVHLSETLKVKATLKQVARFWALYLLGVAKVGWSFAENEIDLSIPRPQKLILDPDATINVKGEYEGQYIGEVKEDTASDLVVKFKDKEDLIRKEVEGKMGTELSYTEWWTPEYVFWTLKREVLGKFKNPHWNYENEEQNQQLQAQGLPPAAPKRNHFKQPKMPYVFLSVFNLGKHPHDDTSLITQNLAAQDVVNKRQRQIDKNVDWMNGGWAVSEEKSGLSRDEAANAIEAARKGGGMWIPQGNPNEAVVRMTGTGLPADVFNQLNDLRNEIRNSFGTRGSTPQGTASEQTVRGKLVVKGQDGDRIGGGIAESLEGVAEQIYNWFVQMILVYYDQPHKAMVIGDAAAQEEIQIDSQTIHTEVVVTVKPGSLIPKDSLTKANQAIDLAQAGLLDPLTLFDRLEFSNPRETSGRLMLFKTNPMIYLQKYFPDLAQLIPPPQPQEKPPSESISFSDLPPEGQAQMAAKVGIQLTPEQIALDEVSDAMIKHAPKREVPAIARSEFRQEAKPINKQGQK